MTRIRPVSRPSTILVALIAILIVVTSPFISTATPFETNEHRYALFERPTPPSPRQPGCGLTHQGTTISPFPRPATLTPAPVSPARIHGRTLPVVNEWPNPRPTPATWPLLDAPAHTIQTGRSMRGAPPSVTGPATPTIAVPGGAFESSGLWRAIPPGSQASGFISGTTAPGYPPPGMLTVAVVCDRAGCWPAVR